MQIALVGLGKMGGNMVQRLLGGGHEVVAYDRSPEAVAHVVEKGAVGASSLADMVSKLKAPKTVWLMLPAGDPTESTVREIAALLGKGDAIIDGSNANWQDTKRRAHELEPKGIDFVDSGTSGGVWGLKNGYCLMIGGAKPTVDRLSPIFTTLAPPDGWAHVGPAGAGHFVKMVHNGIEYGLMQAYAEGFEILEKSEFSPDLHQVTHLWNQASVVRSWLLELAESAFQKDAKLEGIQGWVDDSGMGRWTVQAAIDESVPAPVLTMALQMRFRSRQDQSFAAKVCAALRNEFGGHAVKKA
ncbi:MAG: decarboxylating 6-phosphogluconate dehydrogenase [Myxococcales bacterium]|nr:decarboxylating 6-phosphogluconate dehydrogenase [Myxococcales bacterium]